MSISFSRIDDTNAFVSFNKPFAKRMKRVIVVAVDVDVAVATPASALPEAPTAADSGVSRPPLAMALKAARWFGKDHKYRTTTCKDVRYTKTQSLDN